MATPTAKPNGETLLSTPFSIPLEVIRVEISRVAQEVPLNDACSLHTHALLLACVIIHGVPALQIVYQRTEAWRDAI
jgi:hypothetical protein